MNQQDEAIFLRKMNEKAELADRQQFTVFTDFLDLYEQDLLKVHHKDFLDVKIQLYGGHEACERKMAAFSPLTEGLDIAFPIDALRIHPESLKNKEDLTHRDYLGALMNLGIKRTKMGDILMEEESAVLFTTQPISAFITEQLLMVKNVTVSIEAIENLQSIEYIQKGEDVGGTVSSLRIDSIIKLGFSMSRGNAASLIEAEKVMINSRTCKKPSTMIKEGDVVSVRGFGKMKLKTIGNLTKKNRIFVELFKYI